MIPLAARCGTPMRLPVAARAGSRRANSGLRCVAGFRSDISSLPAIGVAIAIPFKRSSKIARRRSLRSTRKSATPSRAVVPSAARRICWYNSACSLDVERIEQLPAEADARDTSKEIRPHPGRLEHALNRAVAPLAVIMKGEELPGGDDVAF